MDSLVAASRRAGGHITVMHICCSFESTEAFNEFAKPGGTELSLQKSIGFEVDMLILPLLETLKKVSLPMQKEPEAVVVEDDVVIDETVEDVVVSDVVEEKV
jgi:hypothetical protein